jgi:hypothetical protein
VRGGVDRGPRRLPQSHRRHSRARAARVGTLLLPAKSERARPTWTSPDAGLAKSRAASRRCISATWAQLMRLGWPSTGSAGSRHRDCVTPEGVTSVRLPLRAHYGSEVALTSEAAVSTPRPPRRSLSRPWAELRTITAASGRATAGLRVLGGALVATRTDHLTRCYVADRGHDPDDQRCEHIGIEAVDAQPAHDHVDDDQGDDRRSDGK